MKLAVLQNLRMKRRYAVCTVCKMNVHVSHMYQTIAVNDSCALIFRLFLCQGIQSADYRH